MLLFKERRSELALKNRALAIRFNQVKGKVEVCIIDVMITMIKLLLILLYFQAARAYGASRRKSVSPAHTIAEYVLLAAGVCVCVLCVCCVCVVGLCMCVMSVSVCALTD